MNSKYREIASAIVEACIIHDGGPSCPNEFDESLCEEMIVEALVNLENQLKNATNISKEVLSDGSHC